MNAPVNHVARGTLPFRRLEPPLAAIPRTSTGVDRFLWRLNRLSPSVKPVQRPNRLEQEAGLTEGGAHSAIRPQLPHNTIQRPDPTRPQDGNDT